jgi:hypothetical protein
MDIREAYEILVDKVNKLGTNTNAMIPYHVAMRVINEAQTYWYDIRLKKSQVDSTIERELQKFIKTKSLKKSGVDKTFITYTLPDDYYQINNISVLATRSKCELPLDTFLVENANTSDYYLDDNLSPDFSYQQTFAALRDNKIDIYKKDFEIEVSIDYYKKLSIVDIKSDYTHTDGSTSKNVDLEMNGSDAYEVLTIAAQIITGNYQDPGFTVHSNLTQAYN